VRRLGVAVKTDAAEAPGALRSLAAWAARRGLSLLVEKEAADLVPDLFLPTARRQELPSHSDLLVVLGGDGTLLSMARAVGELSTPIVGVNLGDLGFLTATTLDEMLPAAEAALAGRMAIDERMLLSARLVRAGATVGDFAALNDVVITKSAMSRIINLRVAVDGQYATAYRADGLIISTPTGSTAYNLAAGGPIVQPSVDALVLTPVAPHTLTNRPIVIPATSDVRVQPKIENRDEVFVTFDGQAGFGVQSGDEIRVCRADLALRLIRPTTRSYFEVLRQKLKWGER